MNNTCVYCGVIIPEGSQICPHCEYSISKDTTNQSRANKIRSMSINELARLLLESSCKHCNARITGANCLETNCQEAIKAWLVEKGDVF